MRNADQFTVFASKVFDTLYESFPIPVPLARSQLIEDVTQSLQKIRELEWKKDAIESATYVFEKVGQITEEEKENAKKNISTLESKVRDEHDRRRNMERVLEGTIAFLVFEEFVREDDNGYYQLTLRGFTHLNKRFAQHEIQDNTTIIEKLRDALRPEKFAGAVATGVFTSLVSSAFAG